MSYDSYIYHMKIATVADLRNHFRRVSAWIENGEAVQIVKRGKAFARLVPEAQSKPKPKLVKVDFAARRKAIWGDRVFSAAEVKAMRDAELKGGQG
jgi:antitoxin (DNA-binding transcriptional repressor) of toxin-antitoxin stability system